MNKVLSNGSFFKIFDIEPTFFPDLSALEKKFYEMSRALHPDRFISQGSEAQKEALEKMSLINQAYSTLKRRDSIRDYLLKLENISTPKSKPTPLAMEWFELQDEGDLTLVTQFESKVLKTRNEIEKSIFEAEKLFSQNQNRAQLEIISEQMQSLNTLQSLLNDIERHKGQLEKRS